MENAEEVMQLLEEFSKMKPKDIPKELEDYLGYVAKTGDPMYQWSLVKNLFREKLIKVITDFFESTLTVELPPCPNVEPFNYDRMKNSLLERFDTFNSAPFTVQRICELLTNPRKEYNRADKYMRAIEKNILVVSTREPGIKRPLESDSQQETILNGMPDVKVNESDGSLMHVPTDLPYLGAPPASNDVTVETSEPIMADPVNDRVGFGIDINEEIKTEALDSTGIKSWVAQEPSDSVVESEQACSTSELLDVDTFNKEKCLELRDSDADSRFVDLENCPSNSSSPINDIVSGNSSNILILNNEIEVSETASIDSSDSSLNQMQDNYGETVGLTVNDENEVSSTPAEIVAETLVLEEVDVPLDSEAEATGSSVEQSLQSVAKLTDLTESEINSSERIVQSNDTLSIVTITEVSGSNDSNGTVAAECLENEITANVDSPTSPTTSNLSSQAEGLENSDNHCPLIVDDCEQPDIHPDSSNDVSPAPLKEMQILPVEESLETDTASLEADSISESEEGLKEICEPSSDVTLDRNNSSSEQVPSPKVQVSSPSVQVSSPSMQVSSPSGQVSSPSVDVSIDNLVEGSSEKVLEESVLPSSSIEKTIVNEGVCIDAVQEEDQKLVNSLCTNEVAEVGQMYKQEQREESVIQALPNLPSDSLNDMATVEDITVDAGCEVEEEAMDVDDSSNQMMISEGENEGEPMDQSDQLQS